MTTGTHRGAHAGAETRLGRAIGPRAAANPALSGIWPLDEGRDAFAARLLLARAADRTLDLQYYIWRRDLSGMLLFAALVDAAERGVRVRLLLDDMSTFGLDPVLAALDSHPNVEVRLFNPFHSRRFRWLGLLTDFRRLNRRMHNKSFTADGEATIIGGRNVGDEYFAARQDVEFVDLDVLAVGPVAAQVSDDFERYWRSEPAWPVGRLLAPAPPGACKALVAEADAIERSGAAVAYLDAIRALPFVRDLVDGGLDMEWAPVRMLSDEPGKVLGREKRRLLVSERLREVLGTPLQDLALVSAYFVPTAQGVETFGRWAQNGVRVRILTNSLEATDVAAVHAGFAKRRKALLRSGVRLFEAKRLVPRMRTRGKRSPKSSSATSLHAKTFAVDGRRVFIGSFNFDPRSERLNTELGFVIESPTLAGALGDAFDRRLPGEAYEVVLDAGDRLRWIEQRDGERIRHRGEPGAPLWRRALVRALAWLPIESLL
jgi:putative cardiolipin synthase